MSATPPDAAERAQQVRDLARWLRSAGHFGQCPAWYPQLKAAQERGVGPEELDAAYPDTPPASEVVWTARAGIAAEAERQASADTLRRTRRGG
jgi:hypothetical protein